MPTLPATAPVAQAEVRRCQMSTGQTVYTDRSCASIGAVERRAGTSLPQVRRYRASCARNVRDLYFEVSAALESRDVNRLAGVYHWTGMTTRQGYDVMRRLQAVVDRTLVDLQPLYPGGDADWYSPRNRPPYAFRAVQVSAKGSTPMSATLGIRRHLDCWWVTLGVPRPATPAPPSMPLVDIVRAPQAASPIAPRAAPVPAAGTESAAPAATQAPTPPR